MRRKTEGFDDTQGRKKAVKSQLTIPLPLRVVRCSLQMAIYTVVRCSQMKLQMAIYAVVGQTTLRQIVALLCYNAAFSHKMHPIVVKLLPKEAPSQDPAANHTTLCLCLSAQFTDDTVGTVGLLCSSVSLSILGPQSQQGQRLLLHAEDSSAGGGGLGLLAGV